MNFCMCQILGEKMFLSVVSLILKIVSSSKLWFSSHTVTIRFLFREITLLADYLGKN